MRVEDVMLPLDRVPVVGMTSIVKVAIERMTQHHLGVACIVDDAGLLAAVLTDGDLRRMMLRVQKPIAALMSDDAIAHATKELATVTPDTELGEAVATMGERRIWDLPVVDGRGCLVGVLHLHPAVTRMLQAADGR